MPNQSPSSVPAPLDGGCACGVVRYRMLDSPMFVHCCHCTRCQRETGGPFAHHAMIEFNQFKVLQGEPPRTSALSPRLPSPIELTMGNELGLTQVGTIMGTVQYMSPEQWGLEVDIDHRTDLWACGILLYRMICGQHPLHPLEGNQLMSTAQLAVPMPSLAAAAPPEVPRELVEVVDRCLMKAKAQRWQSAGELLAALEPFLPARSAPEVPLSVYAAASRPTGPAASSSAR